jgi:hypothetical protein
MLDYGGASVRLYTVIFLVVALMCGCGESAKTPSTVSFAASDEKVRTHIGGKKTADGRIVTTGSAGFVMFGPYAPWAAGNYEATIFGKLDLGEEGAAFFDVVYTSDQKIVSLASRVLQKATTPLNDNAAFVTLTFSLGSAVQDLQVRASVSGPTEMSITKYEIKRVQ